MRKDPLISQVAAALRLRVIDLSPEGEQGAAHVADDEGQESILKVVSSREWAARLARVTELTDCLRPLKYPIPKYLEVGVLGEASWSLQEVMPGKHLDVMTEPHAKRLLELLSLQEGRAPGPNRWQDSARSRMSELIHSVGANKETADIAHQIEAVIDRIGDLPVLEDSVVHGDFHHRNYLAEGDEITAVIDWEGARVGDWRTDLVNIACWSSVVSWQVPPEIASLFVEHAEDACPAVLLAFLSAHWALGNLQFRIDVHPDQFSWLLGAIEEQIAPWWRAI